MLGKKIAIPKHDATAAALISLRQPRRTVAALHLHLPEAVRPADRTLEGNKEVGQYYALAAAAARAGVSAQSLLKVYFGQGYALINAAYAPADFAW